VRLFPASFCTSFSEQFEFGQTYLHEAIKVPVPVLVSILPACSSSLLVPASLLMQLHRVAFFFYFEGRLSSYTLLSTAVLFKTTFHCSNNFECNDNSKHPETSTP